MEEVTSWHSYPSIFNLGHRALNPLLEVPLNIEEKVDGSQFSFGRFGDEVKVRSKGQQMVIDAPEKMFAQAVETVLTLELHDGWTYRAEYLQKPKHNTLCYDRIPAKHIILFDVNTAEATYLSYEEKAQEAARLGLEVVPLLAQCDKLDMDTFRELLQSDSVLGNTKIEGVVIKPTDYGVFGPDKKCLMAKFVSETFKEKHSTAWKAANPGMSDVIHNLTEQLATEARWRKAIQIQRELGALEDSPRDIGLLLKTVGKDILKEEEEFIREALWKYAWPKIQRGVTAGFSEWYKMQLAEAQLGD